jgi:4-amino-4-deoxy-L-arabinose transferase-like glycosyltransferase
MSRPPWGRLIRWGLASIVLVYLVLGTLYAVYTPAWQAPDEPAHYNYVQFLATQHRFPILKPGDYPASYLEEIKAAHFPPQMTISPIRYEFHQPPLYYLLAVPVYGLSSGALLPLRLLSVVLGALLLPVVYWTVCEVFPGGSSLPASAGGDLAAPVLALGTTAFVAFLPMHLAMTAAVNNDSLAELLLALVVLLAVRYLKRSASLPDQQADSRLLLLLGVTTGLGLVTKSSAYIALPLVLLAIAARHLWLDREPPSAGGSVKAAGLYLLPALALALPWWLRNVALYGGIDILGLGRHAQVVAGQLRTAEFIAQHGSAQLIHDFVLTSFRSFWGQFGWMGVLLDQRLYQALAILSALALVGFFLWVARAWRRQPEIPAWQWAAGGLLALLGLLTLASYLWYNLGFLQHQGRYLFGALQAIGLAAALGWREVLRRERAWLVAGLLLAAAVVLRLLGWLPNWPLYLLGAAAVAWAVRRFLPRRWDPLVQAIPYLLLIPLDLASLFLFIVPQLRL